MSWQRWLAACSLGVLSACELSIDPSLDGKRCDSEGACLEGYVCAPSGICERDGQAANALDASSPANTPALDASSSADVPDSATASTPQASEPLADSPATTTADNKVANTTRDSGVPDAGLLDAATTAAPDAAKPRDPAHTAAADAGISVADPPPASKPHAMTMPTTPPPPGGATPPEMMRMPPGPMQACSAGRVKCMAACVDLQTDSEHCGACNNACRKQESCVNGSCKKPSH